MTRLDLTKQSGDVYTAKGMDRCEQGKRTSRMDIVEETQCGTWTPRVEVSTYGEHRFICPMHRTDNFNQGYRDTTRFGLRARS